MIYNRPWKKKDREFLKEHRLGFEYTVKVKDGPGKMSANPDLAQKAGNRTQGFGTKRNFVPITTGLDGQYMKVRKTACRPRKRVTHRLLSREQIAYLDAMSDPEIRKEMLARSAAIEKARQKAERKANRNPKARKGQK
jgi:hypothetical protein